MTSILETVITDLHNFIKVKWHLNLTNIDYLKYKLMKTL